jgi:hypothetical protein
VSDPPIETLFSGPLAAGTIELAYVPAPPPPGPAIADYIAQRWDHYAAEAQAAGRALFDAPATRLLAWHAFPNPASGTPRLRLTLCPTTYKDFLVTLLRDRPWFLQHAPDAIAPVLGNCILLIWRGGGGDSRGSVLLGVRSPRVSAYPGHAHVIGGVFDRPAPAGGGRREAADGRWLLEHIYTEMTEELGLGPADLASPPTLLGLFRDPVLAQPELLWIGELRTDPTPLLTRPADVEHARFLLVGPNSRHLSALPDRSTPTPGGISLTPLAQMALHRAFATRA